MNCCPIFSDEPLSFEERQQHGKTGAVGFVNKPDGDKSFQVNMCEAPCKDCNSFGWFCYQCLPFTCCCAQYHLRKKLLNNDMSQYLCFQGQFECCCGAIKPGQCYEKQCPEVMLCLESCCLNGLALSATRMNVMEQHNLRSDPMDVKLIRCNNCIQVASCVCDCIAIISCKRDFRNAARILDVISYIVYHTVSGCMTAQVANEMDYRSGEEVFHAIPTEATVLNTPLTAEAQTIN
jgi:hypothetical protein